MLNILFIATPDAKISNEDINFFNSNEKFVQKSSKPYGFVNVFKQLKQHFN